MATHCDNCGCKVYNGTCSNCYEELYIYENQIEYCEKEFSQPFKEKIRLQKTYRDKELNNA